MQLEQKQPEVHEYTLFKVKPSGIIIDKYDDGDGNNDVGQLYHLIEGNIKFLDGIVYSNKYIMYINKEN